MKRPLPEEDLREIATLPIWKSLEGARVLFTGASGFFGSWLLESYLAALEEQKISGKAVALTRNAHRFRQSLPHLAGSPRVDVLEGKVEDAVKPAGPLDVVIHCIVPDSLSSLPACSHFFNRSTRNLLHLAAEARCSHFLLCSTGAVYEAPLEPRCLDESSEVLKHNGPLSYGRIRREVEEACLGAAVARGIPVKIARGFTFAGPRLPLDRKFAFGNFLRDGLAGTGITVDGDGSAVRSYQYAGEMAKWLWTILLRGAPGEIFNVGSETGISIGDLARAFGRQFGVPIRIKGEFVPGMAPSHYVPSTRKATAILQLQTTLKVEDAIEKTARWLRKDAIS